MREREWCSFNRLIMHDAFKTEDDKVVDTLVFVVLGGGRRHV